jgi:cell division protein FtsL
VEMGIRTGRYSGVYLLPGLVVLALTAVGMFMVKNKVQELNRRLTNISARVVSEKEGIHVLQAELAFLNNPKRVKALSDKHLNLKAPKSSQILQPEDLPSYLKSLEAPMPDVGG